LKNRLNRRLFGVLELLFRVLSQIDLPDLGQERFHCGGASPAIVSAKSLTHP